MNMAAKPKPSAVPTLKPVENSDRLDRIVDAIMQLGQEDLDQYDAWQPPADLSSHTEFDGIEPHPDGIYETDSNKFQAVATAYVTLNYGGKGDSSSMSDSYPA